MMTYKGRKTIYESENDEPGWLGHRHGDCEINQPTGVRAAKTLRNKKRITAEKIQTYLKTTMWFLIFVAIVIYVFADFSFFEGDNK